MGVRISFYVLDLNSFERFIDQSIGEMLLFYAQHTSSRELTLKVRTVDDGYSASSTIGVISRQNPKIELTPEKIAQVSFLSTPYRNYLTSTTSFDLSDLLDCCLTIPETTWVRGTKQRNRRWWIGSFLEAAQSQIGRKSSDYLFLVSVFQKMLRGYDCGLVLPVVDFENSFTFPALPADDADHQIGVWSEAEIRRAAQIFQYLLADTTLKYCRPSGSVGIAPETDADWHAWVIEMLNELVWLLTAPFEQPILLSFIG
jgi:hypothetical protein